MKQQYILGVPTKEYIRTSDGRYLIGCSLTLKEAKDMLKDLDKKTKIYKLVEVKK
jgi:hypothetical protein